MKINRTMQTENAITLVYEPIASTPVDPAVHLSDFVRLIVQLTAEPNDRELPVIA